MEAEIIDFLEHLPSGLTVVHDDIPSVGTTALAFFIRVGSRDESPSEWGCAHLLEHLLFKGAGTFDQGAIARQMDKLGGDVNAFTTRDYTCFHARVLDSESLTAYQLLKALVNEPWLRGEDLAREKNVVLEEMRESQDDPDDVVDLLLTDALYADSAYSHDILGTAQSLDEIDMKSVSTFFHKHYRPCNMVFAVSGGATRQVLEALSLDFSRPEREATESPQPFRPQLRCESRHTVSDWEQLHIALAVPAPGRYEASYYSALIAASILGGQNSSRLWQRLREEEGLVYTVGTQYAAEWGFGEMTTYLSLGPRYVERALEVLGRELRRLGEEGPDLAEMERTCTSLFTMLVMGLETPDSRVLRLGRYGLDQRVPSRLGLVREGLLAVDAKAIQDQAKRWLNFDNMAKAWAGPQGPRINGIADDLRRGIENG